MIDGSFGPEAMRLPVYFCVGGERNMIELRGLGKTFQTANGDITALRDIIGTAHGGKQKGSERK